MFLHFLKVIIDFLKFKFLQNYFPIKYQIKNVYKYLNK